MRSKGPGSNLQERVSHTYTLRLGYSRISILYPKKKHQYCEINKKCNENYKIQQYGDIGKTNGIETKVKTIGGFNLAIL